MVFVLYTVPPSGTGPYLFYLVGVEMSHQAKAESQGPGGYVEYTVMDIRSEGRYAFDSTRVGIACTSGWIANHREEEFGGGGSETWISISWLNGPMREPGREDVC